MTPEEFDTCFDRFRFETFRLETLQQYLVDEEVPRVEAFKRGEPRPERSVRTNPWLRRIATTAAAGKDWKRIHAVELPLSEYLRYQIQGYIESQACGEQIRLFETSGSVLDAGDFWLFDGDTADAYAVALRYDLDGRWLGADYINDPDQLARYRELRDAVWPAGTGLNEFLAAHPQHAHPVR